MSIPRFAEYAAAFEKAYASDDWSLVEPFFAEHAVYEVGLPGDLGGRFEGRDAILAYFRGIVEGFDRRFDSRAVELLEGPREEGDTVWIKGRAAYEVAGHPELAFDLDEFARFEGDRIVHLEDRYDEATRAALERYRAEHGEALGIRLP